jgi:MFS transporter, OFA family, oxalate/formate antiporter
VVETSSQLRLTCFSGSSRTLPSFHGRARYVLVAAFLMQLLLGVIYTWSIFRGPLTQLHGWTKAETITPYRYSLLTFAAGMIVGGLWQDRKGPRIVASVGGFLLGTGCLLAAFLGGSLTGLVFSYGIVAGFGLGFAYVTPVATCIKWFPENRGLVTGFCIMGVGVGPLVFAPLIEDLVGKNPSQFVTTIPRTFVILAIIFYVGVIGTAQFYEVPPSHFPSNNARSESGQTPRVEMPTSLMLGTWQFYGIWIVYFLAASVGVTAIGQASLFLQEMAPGNEIISAGTALGILSVFNGLGRFVWGAVSDRISRRTAGVAMCALSLVACLGFLQSGRGFWLLVTGLSLAAFSYGGYIAVIPSWVADYYGPKSFGANYGFMVTAWGICGFVVPGYFERMLDHARISTGLQVGYNAVYWRLSLLAALGGIVAAILRPPKAPDTRSS